MKKTIVSTFLLCLASTGLMADVVLVEKGEARAAIFVPPEVMGENIPYSKRRPAFPDPERTKEIHRRKLRDGVLDLAHYIEKMSGAKVEIHQRPPTADDKKQLVLIDRFARERFGPPKATSPHQQGWRLTAKEGVLGLQGESHEASSYAIYEVLDRLGCRWFIPGEMGEVIPRHETIRLKDEDLSSTPATEVRAIWYSDPDYDRRNRLGGFRISASHELEGYITEKQREENPDWRAVINGKPHKSRLKWSHPEVANAVADAIIAQLDKKYIPTVSLSPDDGLLFDETDDRALDAGDWDEASNTTSITDRYIVLCNRIAERVTKKYPDVLFGFLAYVQYTRPPVREKLHPNLRPEIAPINYCRAHCFLDHDCTSRGKIREIVEGWSKVSKEIVYYNYMFHLAEITAPHPMIRQMSQEIPFLLQHHIRYWQPETMPNFEEVLPGMWISIRLAWDAKIKPEEALDELYTLYYGAAGEAMRGYWERFDRAWTEPPLHAGAQWSYDRRFTPEVLKEAREWMDRALASVQTVMEYRRVEMQNRALLQFERFMEMRRRLISGEFKGLDQKATEWLGTQLALGNEYERERAFGKAGWTPWTIGGYYFHIFMEETMRGAAAMAAEYDRPLPPLLKWKYEFLRDAGDAPHDGFADGVKNGWHEPKFDDAAWKVGDVSTERWADIGLNDARGTMWYRVRVPKVARGKGKRVLLWLAAFDERARVYVNGKEAKVDGSDAVEVSHYAKPATFDIGSLLPEEGESVIAIAVNRSFHNEMGTGGLMGPVVVFTERETPPKK